MSGSAAKLPKAGRLELECEEDEGKNAGGGTGSGLVLSLQSGDSSQIAASGEQDEERKLEAQEDDPGVSDLYIKHEAILVDIFPAEVWTIILEHMEDPNDLQSVTNASPFFRSILLPKREMFLFAKVFETLATHYHETHASKKCGTVAVMARHVFKDSKILNLRLVCKSWNQIVTRFYQHHPSHFEMKLDPECAVARTTTGVTLRNYTVRNFFQHFKITHDNILSTRNPFLSRSLVLNVDFTAQGSWNRIFVLLSKYGEHVWYLHLNLLDFNLTPNQIQPPLRRLLLKVPNLKALKITENQKYLLKELKYDQLAVAQLLPTLESLQCLQIEDLDPRLCNELIHRNTHITMLQISPKTLQDSFQDYEMLLPNLKQLSIYVGLTTGQQRSLEVFRQLRQVEWGQNLTNLILHFDEKRKDFGVPWSEVFTFLEKQWASTVTELSLKLPKSYDARERKKLLKEYTSLRLNLPRLKHLELFLTEHYSVDFILPMKDTLEFFDVHMSFTPRNSTLAVAMEAEQKIQFLGYSHQPLESNMWSMFPKLKRFRLFGKDSWEEPISDYFRIDWLLKRNANTANDNDGAN